MYKPLRVVVLALLVAVVVPSAFVPRQAAAESQQVGLHLRRTHFFMDDKGQVWLSAQFINDDNRPINVAGVAPTRWGPWTAVGQKVEPGATVHGALRVNGDTPPSVVWVDSSQGLLRFELPKRK